MTELANHELMERIDEGARSTVYLGRSKRTHELSIIKVARNDGDVARNIATLRHQYDITKDLDLKGIVKVRGLEVSAEYAALIMEHFDGTSLQRFIETRNFRIEPAQVAKIAVQLADTLGAIHARNIVHKDINPNNIIINEHTLEVKITDFSIASLLPAERPGIHDNISRLEGTLPYLSPEQTGRMNRSIDYRSDYYSLGVTLYQLSTGRLPFDATDPMELVHCHIARTPTPPHQIQPSVPEVLSKVIMKLLSKTAEDRYQSAFRLKADLEFCLDVAENGAIVTDFVPARGDKSDRLQVSEKLYGRRDEVEALLAAFDRVSGSAQDPTQGQSELVLVAGYSGIGKSSIVNEIHKRIARQGGYFIAGKFDQLTRNNPYASLIAALRELVCQLLTETEAQLENWKKELLDAISPNGQVIADVIPDIELIIGKQPPIRPLGPAEIKNRFDLTFRSFIRVFAARSRTLVIFLDDLQWADTASLNLIGTLMSDPEIQHLLLIGAYRDNEVDAAHPLMIMLNALPEKARVRTITLRPLTLEHVNELVADTLSTTTERCRPLSEHIAAKTHGNPFFIIQLLVKLYTERRLSFDPKSASWQWNVQEIEELGITDNVVDLMIRRIGELGESAQRVVKLAACIGNQFDLKLLALIHDDTVRATAEALWGALESGLVVPLHHDYKITRFFDDQRGTSVSYKFLHDRVQQAAYAMLPDGERKQLHLELAQFLVANTPESELEEHVYDVVIHLNMGADLVVDRQKRLDAAVLNLKAGQKARRSMAYEPTVQCLRAAIAFLPGDCWETDHELALSIYTELVELEYLTANFDRGEELAKVVLEHTRDVLEKIRVWETRIQFYILHNRAHEAIEMALSVLAMLDVSWLEAPPPVTDIDGLADLPAMTDKKMLAAMRILMSMAGAVYQVNPALIAPLAYTMLDLCVRHGNSPVATYSYGFYGLTEWGRGNIDRAFRFGQLGLRMIEPLGAGEMEAKVYAVHYAFFHHWKRHLRETIEPLLHGIQVGLNTGDFAHAGYCSMGYATHPLFYGEELSAVHQRMNRSVELSVKLKQDYSLYWVRIWRQFVLGLRDPSVEQRRLVGESFDETTMIPCLGNNLSSMFALYLAKGMQLYYAGDPGQALDALRLGERCQGAVAGYAVIVEYAFYCSLCLLAIAADVPAEDRGAALEGLTPHLQNLEMWASHAPANDQHKHDLVQAERLSVLGSSIEAMEHYDRAIEGARKHGFIHEEALSYELASLFYFKLGRLEIARHYMSMAYHGYLRWGAHAKCQSLLTRFPKLVVASDPFTGQSVSATTGSRSSSRDDGAALDLLSIVKASQALASEVVLEKLLHSLMRIVIENTGAQTGFLALTRDGTLYVEAEGSVDQHEIRVLQAVPVAECDRLPATMVNYVARTKQSLIIDDAGMEMKFSADPYIQRKQPKSVMCAPIVAHGRLVGVFYFENNLSIGVFTKARLEILKLLSAQVWISIENAKLYGRLERSVATRTEELRESNEQLQTVNERLRVELTERERLQQEQASMQQEIIQTQRARLLELSTPLIPITEQIMVMPLIGTLDAQRAAQMLETALNGVVTNQARVVIVDITGVASVDTSVAAMLTNLAKALGLVGTEAIITGIRPAVAQTLVTLGVELATLRTRGDLKAGIAYAMRRTGEAGA